MQRKDAAVTNDLVLISFAMSPLHLRCNNCFFNSNGKGFMWMGLTTLDYR